jgi:hypothetical protein
VFQRAEKERHLSAFLFGSRKEETADSATSPDEGVESGRKLLFDKYHFFESSFCFFFIRFLSCGQNRGVESVRKLLSDKYPFFESSFWFFLLIVVLVGKNRKSCIYRSFIEYFRRAEICKLNSCIEKKSKM